MNNNKTCLIIGAGATFADAVKKGLRFDLPPLDKNFFWNHHISYIEEKDRSSNRARGLNYFIMNELNSYFQEKYGYDICTKESPHDSLEKVLKTLYTDIFISDSTKKAEDLLVKLITFLNKLISTSTGRIKISGRNRLTKVINKLLNDCQSPDDLTIISYNYDLQAEKTVHFLSHKYTKFRSYFEFPNCYCLPPKSYKLTAPTEGSTDIFDLPKHKTRKSKGIKILKPHGSLNWFSLYPSKSSLLSHISKSKNIMISRRLVIPKVLTFKGERTFPVVIPPLVNKGTFIKKTVIDKVWDDLRSELITSSRIVVYGYSCPEADAESFNLFSQVFTGSRNVEKLDIINPDSSIIERLQSAIKAPVIHYYEDADYYT